MLHFHGDRRAQKQIIQRADYEFSLSMADGAVLVLPEGAQSCDLENERRFLDEAVRHGIHWYECATEDAGRFIRNDTFYLITGFHKARSWSLGAAGRSSSSPRTRRSAKFKVGTIHQGRETAQAYSWERATGFMGRFGPMRPYQIPYPILGGRAPGGVPNQTVFVRGFRITVNRILFLKTVSVKTQQGTSLGFGTHVVKFLTRRTPDSTSSSDTQSATDNMVEQDFSGGHGRLYADAHMTVDRVPDVSQVRLSLIMTRDLLVMSNKSRYRPFIPATRSINIC